MPGIDPEVICHNLSIKADAKPVKQMPREWTKKGVVPSVTKSIAYSKLASSEKRFTPTSSPIPSSWKKNGKWRVCIDFTNLNEACPKDNYPLPRIDQLTEVTAGHELLSFMDAYFGYNQIKMHPPDEDKTAFTTGWGIYCYKVMPFGLKNAWGYLLADGKQNLQGSDREHHGGILIASKCSENYRLALG